MMMIQNCNETWGTKLFTHSLIIFFLMSQLVSEVKLREEEGQITTITIRVKTLNELIHFFLPLSFSHFIHQKLKHFSILYRSS